MRVHVTLLCVSAAATAAAQSRPSLLDEVLKRYLRPRVVVGDGALHLFYQSKRDSQEAVTTCYRRFEPGKGWTAETAYHDDYLAVEHFDGALFVFRTSQYSVYRGKDWWTRPWPLGWPPMAACAVGDELWVFGPPEKEATYQLSAARLVRRGGELPGYEPKPLGEPLELDGEPEELSAVALGASAVVFWQRTVSEPSLTTETHSELWHATFDGRRWTEAAQIPLPYRNADYAAAEHGGRVWVFARERGRRLSSSRPLVAIRQAEGGWSAPVEVPDAVDSRFDWTFGLDAVSFQGALVVARACWSRLVIHRWRDGEWLPLEALSELPAWVPAARWWIIGNGLVMLVLLPVVLVCALRARHRPRQLALADSPDLQAATWARRVAAALLDTLLTQFLSAAAIALLSLLYGSERVAESLFLMVAVHPLVFFVYFIATEGLTGQSFGKRLLSIAVIGQEGRRASLGQIVLRNLLKPSPFLIPVGYLVGSIILLLTPRWQRLGDLLARTLVVEAPPLRPQPSSSP